jgi:hypothetical protein
VPQVIKWEFGKTTRKSMTGGPSKQDREKAAKEALEALRNAKRWPLKDGESVVDTIRRLRQEREDYLAARHDPRPK